MPTLSRREINIIVAASVTGMALSALNATSVNTALLTIVSDLGGLKSYTWIATAYFLTSTASTPLFGRLSDLYGRKRLLQLAIAIFIFGSLLCAASQNMGQLVMARAVQGIGGGGLTALVFAVIADLVSPRERGTYGGYTTAVFAAVSVIGPLVGGFLTQALSWRWIFLVNVPLGLIVLTVINRVLKLPHRRREHSIDWIGAMLLVAGVASIVMAVSWAPPRWGWASPGTVGLASGAALLVALFLWRQTRAAEPIVPLSMFQNRVVRVGLIMASSMQAVMFASSTFLPLFLQAVTGLSPTRAGLMMTPVIFSMTIMSITSGRRIRTTGRYRVWPIFGTACAAIAVLLLTTISDHGLRFAFVFVAMGFLGFGIGATQPTANIVIQNAVSADETGLTTSMAMFFRQLAATVMLAVFGAVLNAGVTGKVDPAVIRSPASLRALPAAERAEVVSVLDNALRWVFIAAVPLVVIAVVCAIILEELPLREDTMHRPAISDDERADADLVGEAGTAVTARP